ncbi:hypothetical protein FRB96_004068 [Tulasnella sp. 330]|nr:hypothetical protein FRB96_004068 [Tulasnella sp. 330]
MNAHRAIILALFAAGSTMSMPLTHAAPSQLSRRDNPNLNTKQQQWAYEMRALNNEYRNGASSLDREGQLKVVEKADNLQEGIAHDEHMPYTRASGTGVFDQIDILAQDDNVMKLDLDHEELEHLQHLQREVTEEISQQQREHHITKRSLQVRDTSELNMQQQAYADAARRALDDWRSEMDNLDEYAKLKELKKVQNFVKSLAKREHKPFVPTPGMKIFDQASILLEDGNIAKLALRYLGRHHRLNHQSNQVYKEIKKQAKHHSLKEGLVARSLQARSPKSHKHEDELKVEDGATPELNTEQQDYAQSLRKSIDDWEAALKKVDTHGQVEILAELRDFVKTLAKKEGRTYTPRPGMTIIEEARYLANDANV